MKKDSKLPAFQVLVHILISDKVAEQGVKIITIDMTRNFTPIQDIKSIYQLFKIFRKEKYDLIHYNTPKGAFLSAIAGFLARRGVMLYTLRGLGYESYTGIKRKIAEVCEMIACRLADKVIAISQTLKNTAVSDGIIKSDRAEVIGAGSSKGADVEKFRLSEELLLKAREIRKALSLDEDAVIVGYAGRLAEDKGIEELVEAFLRVNKKNKNAHLLLVGDQDQRQPLPDQLIDKITSRECIHQLPFSDDIEILLAAMDIVVLPSRREGFGNILIEASALERPVIATDSTGCRDAVINNETGLIFKMRDVDSLEAVIYDLVQDKEKRETMGTNGGKWVRDNFDRRIVWQRLINLYIESYEVAVKTSMPGQSSI